MASDPLPSAPQEPPVGLKHDAECEAELTSHGYTECRCAERASAPQEPPQPEHFIRYKPCGCSTDYCQAHREVASAPQTGSTEAPKVCNDMDAYLRQNPTSVQTERLFRRAMSALSTASAPPQGWQPIATAPKDGTDILVYLKADGETFPAYIALIGYHNVEIRRATHWMPLPAPPASPSEECEP